MSNLLAVVNRAKELGWEVSGVPHGYLDDLTAIIHLPPPPHGFVSSNAAKNGFLVFFVYKPTVVVYQHEGTIEQLAERAQWLKEKMEEFGPLALTGVAQPV